MLDVRVRAGLPPVFADRAQLESALVNLAVNARDAMARGGNLAIAAAHAESRAGDAGSGRRSTPATYVEIAVADDGAGMPPDVGRRAIDPFFTTKPPGKGTGLGLSHVYGFARQSGGDLHIESEVGRGTTIRLRLPVAPGSAGAQRAAPPAPRRPGRETRRSSSWRTRPRSAATSCARSRSSATACFEARDGPAALLALGAPRLHRSPPRPTS